MEYPVYCPVQTTWLIPTRRSVSALPDPHVAWPRESNRRAQTIRGPFENVVNLVPKIQIRFSRRLHALLTVTRPQHRLTRQGQGERVHWGYMADRTSSLLTCTRSAASLKNRAQRNRPHLSGISIAEKDGVVLFHFAARGVG